MELQLPLMIIHRRNELRITCSKARIYMYMYRRSASRITIAKMKYSEILLFELTTASPLPLPKKEKTNILRK